MRARLSGPDLVLILAVVALWGYTFVPIKVALAEVPPFALAALRFLLAAVPVCLVVRPPPFGLPIPVSGLACGAMFLHERIVPLQALGVVLVFTGLLANVYRERLQAGLRNAL